MQQQATMSNRYRRNAHKKSNNNIEGDEDTQSEASGLSFNIEKQLATDIEGKFGGLRKLESTSLTKLADQKPKVYGDVSSKRRKAIKNRVYRWTKKPLWKYIVDLQELGVEPSDHTVNAAYEATEEERIKEKSQPHSSPQEPTTKEEPTAKEEPTTEEEAPIPATPAARNTTPFPFVSPITTKSIMSGYPADFDSSRCSKYKSNGCHGD